MDAPELATTVGAVISELAQRSGYEAARHALGKAGTVQVRNRTTTVSISPTATGALHATIARDGHFRQGQVKDMGPAHIGQSWWLRTEDELLHLDTLTHVHGPTGPADTGPTVNRNRTQQRACPCDT